MQFCAKNLDNKVSFDESNDFNLLLCYLWASWDCYFVWSRTVAGNFLMKRKDLYGDVLMHKER